jgi:carbon starvation protein
MVDGLQLVLALALMTLAVLVVKHCGLELLGKEEVELAHGH